MSEARALEQDTKTSDLQKALAGKYLTFALAGEEYGLPVLRVREIIKVMDITVVPQVPAYVRGVINLRGKVIPVIDLRLKFNFEAKETTDRTAIIVVELELPGGRTLVRRAGRRRVGSAQRHRRRSRSDADVRRSGGHDVHEAAWPR